MHVTTSLLKNLEDCIFVIEPHFFDLLKLLSIFFTGWSCIGRSSCSCSKSSGAYTTTHHGLHHSWVHTSKWILLSSCSHTRHSTCCWHSTSCRHTSSTRLAWHTSTLVHTLHHLHGLAHCLRVHHLSHQFRIIKHCSQLGILLSHLL